VARGTQHRKRRPTAHARVAAAQPAPSRAPRRPRRPEWEDQLFFGRLRAHAKWVFVMLAFVFALSFVVFGVGSGSSGISQVIDQFFSGSSSTGSSLSSLQKQTVQHPKDATAWFNYANKLEADGKDDDAATALQSYSKLRPKDQNALLQLAGIYLQRAQDWETLYSSSQARIQALSPTSSFNPSSTSALGKAFAATTNPIAGAVSSENSSTTSNEYQQVITYLSERLGVYQKLAKLTPNDATTQYNLAQAASDAGDTKSAIAAYKAFLKLAPTDPQASTAKAAIKQLQAAQAASAAASSSSSGK
jgi:Flp pilus assembly protein TadD